MPINLAAAMPSYQAPDYADVSVDTIDDAVRTIAIHSGADLIASLVSEMPIQVWDAPLSDPNRKRVNPPKWLEDPQGDGYGVADWLYQGLTSYILRGNIFGMKIDEDRNGVLRQCGIIHPDLVQVDPESIGPNGKVVGEPRWLVGGQQTQPGSVKHWRSATHPGTLMGPSIIQMHAIAIGLPQVAGAFGRQWFVDGAHPSGILINEMEDIAGLAEGGRAEMIKKRFMASMRGSREPALFGRGWKYQPIQVKAEESQFLATLGYSEAQCARIFGPGVAEILGYESGNTLTYANVESRAAHLLTFGIGKWITRTQRLLESFLPRGRFVTMDRSQTLNPTPTALYAALKVALSCRLMTPNEARGIAGLPPEEWGVEPNPIAGANVIGADGQSIDTTPDNSGSDGSKTDGTDPKDDGSEDGDS